MFTSSKENHIQLLGVGFPLHDLRKTGVYAVLDPLDAPTSGAYFVTVYNHRISVRETVQVIHHADIGSSWSRYWDASGWSAWLPLAQVAGSGNLAIGDVTADAVEIRIDTGTDATILAATETDAGVMSAADKTKLNAIEPGAEANPSAEELVEWLDTELGGTTWRTGADLSMSRTATTVTVEIDPGTDAELLAASEFLAGVMTAADKAKLNGIEAGATADMDGSEIVSAINATLGSTSWQNADPGSEATNPSVRVATTTNIDIANDLNDGDTIDGVTLAATDLVLVKDQSNPEENGIYVVGVTPARHTNFDEFDNYPGIIVTVQEGTANDDTVWLCTSNSGGTLGTDSLTFLQTEITPTNLSTDRDATTVTVNSSTGSGGVIPAATGSLAGVMTAADKTKLDGLDAAGNTSVEVTHNASDVDLGVSGAGTGDTIDAATTSTAGVMTAADKTKLDGIEAGAQVNPSASDLVTALNGELGGTGWQIDPSSPVEAKAFLARRTSSQTIATSPTTVTFPTEVYDADDVHNAGTGAYQPGVTGVVMLSVSVSGQRANVSSSWGDLQIVKNGATVLAQVRDTNTVVNNIALSVVDTCSPTDVYTVRSVGASGDGGAILQGVFSGCLIYAGSVEFDASTNLTFTRDGTTVTVESDTGTDAALPAATGSLAGVMSAADKAKLDGLEEYVHPNHTGDVTSVGDGTTTISNNAVSNAKLADVATNTIKGRVSASTGDPEDLTPSQVRTLLNVEDNAQENPSDAEIVSAINSELGGTGWQSSGVTNLTFTRDGTTVTVESDTGTDAALPAATDTLAGVMSAADKAKLDGVEAGATGDLTGAEIVSLINGELGSTVWQTDAQEADEVPYDNVESGLDAENVQDALDEIVDDLGNIPAGTNLSFSRDATTVTVASNTGTDAVLPAATVTDAGVMTAADKTKLDGVESGADVTDATNVAAAGAVMETDYNAHTILAATTDDTPAALTVGEATIVGRATGGNIAALTATQVRTIINVEDGATGDQDADEVPFDNTASGLTATDVQGAIDEVEGRVDALEAATYPTNLDFDRDATTVTVESDTGTDAVLPAATTTLAGVMTGADKTKLDGIEAGADVTDATNVDAAGAVMNADYNAQTILAATADNTPAPLTVGEATIVGRATGGNIAALTATQVRTIINVENGADVTDATNVNAAGAVMEADYNAQTILRATTDNTPTALTVGEQTLVGRITGGNIEALTPAQARTLLNVADGANNYTHPNHSGDVTSVGDGATTIANNAVTNAKLRDSAALSVIGRSANSSGDPADIAAANDGEVLRRNGTSIGFGTVATAGIANGAVTNAKLADMAQNTIKGRITGSTGDPEDLTAANVRAIINVENGATADMTGAEIVAAINSELGSTVWQDGGGGGAAAYFNSNLQSTSTTTTTSGDGSSDPTVALTKVSGDGSVSAGVWTPGVAGTLMLTARLGGNASPTTTFTICKNSTVLFQTAVAAQVVTIPVSTTILATDTISVKHGRSSASGTAIGSVYISGIVV
jgi:hypothetical protein